MTPTTSLSTFSSSSISAICALSKSQAGIVTVCAARSAMLSQRDFRCACASCTLTKKEMMNVRMMEMESVTTVINSILRNTDVLTRFLIVSGIIVSIADSKVFVNLSG